MWKLCDAFLSTFAALVGFVLGIMHGIIGENEMMILWFLVAGNTLHRVSAMAKEEIAKCNTNVTTRRGGK